MADQPTPEEWHADLQALKDAIQVVKRESTTISEHMTSIDTKMSTIGTHWSSPAYHSFDAIKTWFQKGQHDLESMLKDITKRMETSYTNYHNAESANFKNLHDDGGPNG
ncbi:WXG100 family type VII secretion target [Streptomyces sp. NPDC057654]|uniref:WXG100 family type VII secretion target n=1 Tax=Streptomyces sp. NPDC057654 TaxID=3346196 RepID=UPI00367D33B6